EAAVKEYAEARLIEAVRIGEKQARYDAIDAINEETLAHFAETYPEEEKQISEILHDIVKTEVRRLITH
ncbi:hypothetical protein, partial [Acinetobacter baumannii]|uniref:hypothetical protein n=1 Tax=Acinetobacter baumannii TaxID=470 RepID=UPI000A72573B